MAYTIKNTDGTTLLILAEGTIDQSATSLTLIGKNYSNFGQFYNNNLITLLANSANGVAPNAPLIGQLWYDTVNNQLKVYNGAFKQLSGATVSGIQPNNLSNGDLWWDSTNNQLKINVFSQTYTVGSQFSSTIGSTGWNLPTSPVYDNDNIVQQVLLLQNYGNIVGYISNGQFVINTVSNGYLTENGNMPNAVQGLTIFGNVQANNLVISTPPQYSTSTGIVGQLAYGSTSPNVNYLYVCTATNQWSRIQITDTGPW